MKIVFALTLTSLIACKVKPFVVTDAPLVTVALDQPACAVQSTAQPLTLTFSAGDATNIGTVVGLVVELTPPTGDVRVLDRATLQGDGTFTIPAGTLGAGSNKITVWVDQGARGDRQTFTVEARTPIAGASDIDADGDCYSAALGDCNDADPAVHPNASETCNGKDDNCDGHTDEPFDKDGDTFVACPDASTMVSWRTNGLGCPAGFATCSDCDDSDPRTYPGAFTNCTDTANRSCSAVATTPMGDDDGDGIANCNDPDSDNDGVCDPGATQSIKVTACADPKAPDGACCSDVSGQADNCPRTRNSAQSDADSDGSGDACDACTDFDRDGYGRAGMYTLDVPGFAPIGPAATHWLPTDPTERAKLGTFQSTSCGSGIATPDCDDTDANAFPGNSEKCDGKDNNCDGHYDEAFDPDNDGFVDCGMLVAITHQTSGAPCPTGYASCPDCNAGISSIHPGAAEPCNGQDDDCFGGVDQATAADGSATGRDPDADGFNDCGSWNGAGPIGTGTMDATKIDCAECLATSCVAPGIKGSDVHPGAAEPCDGVDNDCNGTADDQSDQDGDSYTTCGVATIAPGKYDRKPPGNSIAGGAVDCNDDPANGGAAMHPGASEICDGLDNDCNCPYGGPIPNWAALPDTGFGAKCIDDTSFDPDGDNFAGGAGCPPVILRNTFGKKCATSVVRRILADGSVAPAVASCFDCNECQGPSCVTSGIVGTGVHPNAIDAPSGNVTEAWNIGATCADRIDNDCDGYVDQLDAECAACRNQTELYRESFDQGTPAQMVGTFASDRWQYGISAAAGPFAQSFAEGRANGVLGTNGNLTSGSTFQVEDTLAAAPSSYWIAGGSRTGASATTGTLQPFNWSATTNQAIFVGMRSFTYNQGYPAWDAAAPHARFSDGGTCSDGRGASFNATNFSARYFGTVQPFTNLLDVESVRVSTSGAPTSCVGSSSGFSDAMTCSTTPELGFPFDGAWRVLRSDITAALGPSRATTYLCGRFSTNEPTLGSAPACFGGNGTTATAWSITARAPPGIGAPSFPACSAANADDGWYIDDLVVYACDDLDGAAATCDQTLDPVTRIPAHVVCGPQQVCCGGSSRCAPDVSPSAPCVACVGGEQACNTVCCPSGTYCADFANSYCSVANVNIACGPTRSNCNQTSTQCAYVVGGGTDEFTYPASYALDLFLPRDCTSANSSSASCRCVNPIYDDFCGTGLQDATRTPRENCMRSYLDSNFNGSDDIPTENVFRCVRCSEPTCLVLPYLHCSSGGNTDGTVCACSTSYTAPATPILAP